LPDIIQLLSDHLANQIAAGEVIQRPASAVKELMENAIDAGANEIQLVIKDAGKELLQVIDNGSGMSATDARMSFERHATSKIKDINDLFSIRTMGFRGEALASIAAVAQVEMRTRKAISEIGNRIRVEATEVKEQEPFVCEKGTNIMVKNLFYNVPARRHFLKGNTTELRHILDEFTRIALAYPDIRFRFWNNNTEQYNLEPGNLKTRIVSLLGNNLAKNLVPVDEFTDLLNIKGFIGKPEAATKTRGMQFFFINQRFIKSAYLHHAVTMAYEGLIEKDSFPFYVLMLDIDPARVDVNVHPTKQEVKFEDDRLMYAYLNAAVKHALAKYNIAPSLDFTLNPEIQHLPSVELPQTPAQMQQTQKGYLSNTFRSGGQAHFVEAKDSLQRWKEVYAIAQQETPLPEVNTRAINTLASSAGTLIAENEAESNRQNILLVQDSLLLTTVKSGLMLIHIKRAQERIAYEKLLQQWSSGGAVSQRSLFPQQIELAPQDSILLDSILPDLVRTGFDVAPFGKHTYVVQGMPPEMAGCNEKQLLDEMIEMLKNEAPDAVNNRQDRLLITLAKRSSRIKQNIKQTEMQQALIDELFACSRPEYSPDGKRIFTLLRKEELDALLA